MYISYKQLFLAFAFLSLLTMSCVEEIEETMPVNPEQELDYVEPGPHVVFTAAAESADNTKAILNGYDVLWTAGDEISVSDNKGNTAVYSAGSDGISTEFVYKHGSTLSTEEDVVYTAWYPKECAGGYLSGMQEYAEDGIHGIPMKAVSSSDTHLQFKNLTGIVKVHLRGTYTNICALVLAAEKPVSGEFSKDIQPGLPAEISGSGTSQIVVPEGPGRDITSGKDYFFAIPAGRYKELWLGVLNADGHLAYYKGSEIAVGRSSITTIGPVDVLSMGNVETRDLSQSSTANCYIADANCDYKFRADVKGNSTEVISATSADVLWDEGTGDGYYSVIRPAILYDGYVWFRKNNTDEDYTPGNALVAVRDASGNILWSWHIWGTQEISSSTWVTAGYEMMDRNLGAWSADNETEGSAGLLYQWGRKDPFPIVRSDVFPESVPSNSTVGTISYAISHPTQWIYGIEATCYDWSYSVQNGSAWNIGGVKGLYDPCPPGWSIPDGAGHGIVATPRGTTSINLSGFWSKAFNTGVGFFGKDTDGTLWWDSTSSGMTVPSTVAGTSVWFPATGYFAAESGELVAKGYEGSIWTSGCEPVMTSIAASSYCMSFGGGRVCPTSMSGRAAGRSVRCIKR